MQELMTFSIPVLAPNMRVYKDSHGEPWFLAKDVCDALGVNDVSAACKKVPLEDKGTTSISTPGGVQEVLTLSEPGMYWVVARSDKPAARPFLHWITHEVAPAIRKNGQYTLPGQRKPTRWGWQPIRDIAQARGYSMRDLVQSMNALDMPNVPMFSDSNFAAWSYGSCLPADALVIRAERLLGLPREELFTADVLAHYQNRGAGKRHKRVID